MKTRTSWIACFAIFVSAVTATAEFPKKSNLLREKGATYLDSLLDKPLKLKVLKNARSYYSLKGKRYLGTMPPGQMVTVLAVSDRAFRVRGRAQQGQVAGWVSPKSLTPVNPAFLKKLKKQAERQELIADLIAKKQVALGMTLGEVKASLGRPDEKSSFLDQTGRHDVYSYVTYDRVPQFQTVRDAYGRLFQQRTYIKVEVGRLDITFDGELVSSIAEKEGQPNGGRVRRVPPPIIF